MLGRVKWFNNEKGYGFAISKDGDVFVHYSHIQTNDYKSLSRDQIISFDLSLREEGLLAKNIIVVKDVND